MAPRCLRSHTIDTRLTQQRREGLRELGWREPRPEKPWMAAPEATVGGGGAGQGEVATEGFTHHRLGRSAQLEGRLEGTTVDVKTKQSPSHF